MKKIKTKLFCIFMVLMISLILCGILLNSIFLESYYIYKNKGTLISVSKKIKEEYAKSNDNNYEYADMIQSIDDINTVIVDKNYNIKYNSLHIKSTDEEKKLAKEMSRIISENEKKLLKKSIYYVDEKNNDQKTKLVLISQADDGEYIILKKSFKSIHESVVIANEFYVIAGCLVIVVGAILILIFSNKITKPIIEMSKVAENISNLKFDKVATVSSEDEIGRLGNSINKISDKLNKSINELKQDVERKKELVRNMSHELKTPIGIIKGYAEGLKYGVVNDREKIEKYCTILVEECDRMDELVKELLNYSMMEGGMINLNLTEFYIDEFLNEIVERFKLGFIENNINFHLNCVKNTKICADRSMLEKAINNFISNAIHHASGRKIINIMGEKEENTVKISVYNTGDNIPEEERNKIWDVCYKIEKSRSRKYGGHGIGLSIVRLIAQLHNGTAKVENVEDGVTFSLEMQESPSLEDGLTLGELKELEEKK